jgi:hypothetical protein
MTQPHTTIGEDLLKAHATLVEALQGLESPRTQARQVPGELVARLERTRALLAEHFRFEEQEGGGFAAILRQQPHAHRAVKQFVSEHRELLVSLEALRDEARRVASAWEALHDTVAEWSRKVRRHEQDENLLVEDAFNRDTGSDD